MTAPTNFLTSLSKAVSAMTLYKADHPARKRAIATCFDRLLDLLAADERPEFTFLGDQIVYNKRPLRSLKNWDWGRRLASVGIQRLEILESATREELEEFLEEVLRRASDEASASDAPPQTKGRGIRYGEAKLKGEHDEGTGFGRGAMPTATLSFDLQEETQVVSWVHEEVRKGGALRTLEADAVVRSLSVAMHGHQRFLIPLLKLGRHDEYSTSHALNVSVLAMALGEFMGLGSREVQTFGTAGLLHDLGSLKIPQDILGKPGELTDADREVVERHPAEGARILLENEEDLEVEAIVAYEHHVRADGGGYPSFTYPRSPHLASRIVHVCTVFDALLSERPFRKAWDKEKALAYVGEGAGSEFDSRVASSFLEMMRSWGDRVTVLHRADEALPLEDGPHGADRAEADAPTSGGTGPSSTPEEEV